jgi:hypothetical protein
LVFRALPHAKAAHSAVIGHNPIVHLVIFPAYCPNMLWLLQAKPWLCVACQMQHERQTRATKLFLHPMSYLTKPQPTIQDMGPTPACGSQACATFSTQLAQQMMAEIMRAA